LDRDDPDVKRLIEAMAFFAARTHMAGLRNITASHRRIFQQFFPYLLTTKPAMAVLQAVPSGQFVEPAFLPRGSEIAISSPTEGTAFFRTIGDLSILPISLTKTHMLSLPDKRFRLVLGLEASYPRNEEIGWLGVHINHLNDYQASLRVYHMLKKYIRRASVVFQEEVTETTWGTPCELSFGLMHSMHQDKMSHGGDEECGHPLQKEQLFFHFPQQDLYLNIHVPPPPRNWSRVTILIDLDPKWPRNLRLTHDVFHLFTIPIINLKRAMAQPVIHDGTRERCSVRYSGPGKGFELHSILGVYRVEKKSLVPIKAGIIAGGSGSYEIEQDSESKEGENKGKSRHCLALHLPQSFHDPQTIAVDALWFQPWFSKTLSQKLKVAPYSRNIIGLGWEIAGSVVPHAESRFGDEMDDFLHLITLKNKSVLNIDDLVAILRILGNFHQGSFQQIVELLADVRVEEAPFQKRGTASAVKLVYYLRLKGFDPANLPLVETFIAHMGRILDIWISEAAVEVRLEVPGDIRGNIRGDNREQSISSRYQ
ncbi:MAG: type VI secretion system baseplate subunit TssF, partial [bacterium]